MCLKYVKIKNHLQAGISHCYVPCGICEDCRRKQAHEWSWRINAEFLNLKKQGFNVAFCTLTYRPKDLPTIPEICFKSDYKEIPCFNRKQVRAWIDDVRQYCKFHFAFVREKRMRYFIATELGTLRHRPHMHCILAWPNSVSYEEMHKICSDKWKYGFLFPRRPEGDGKCLSFEIVGDPSKCLTYVSKYVCKDLELMKLQSDCEFFNERNKYEEDSNEMLAYDYWRNCQSFHLQSQSLGLSAIQGLSDYEKMNLYQNGLVFSADKEAEQIPIYIKRKLLFDPWYCYDDEGKRIVKKKANAFFLAHAHEIFDKKAEWYQKYLTASESKQYYLNRGLAPDLADKLLQTIRYYRRKCDFECGDLVIGNMLGKYYLAYYRVDYNYCYDIDLCNQWLLRYYPDANLIPRIGNEDFSYRLSWLQSYFEAVDNANSLLGSIRLGEREKESALERKCLDFFNNIIQ